jgi:hypothetical protein
MKHIFLAATILVLLISSSAYAQDCNIYVWNSNGSLRYGPVSTLETGRTVDAASDVTEMLSAYPYLWSLYTETCHVREGAIGTYPHTGVYLSSEACIDGIWEDELEECYNYECNSGYLSGTWDVICGDADLDDILDDNDNCPEVANPNQEDADSDGTGDFCDNNTIFGHVSDYYFGDAQEGITVNIYILSCGVPQPYSDITTDAQGYYAIGDLANSRYLVGPEDAGYSFSSSKWVDITQAEIQSYDFTATRNCTCDDVGRYLDNGDGTITDCRTCLIWLKDVSCLEVQGVEDGEAELNSGECGLSDGSVEGDWRRPTPTELQSVLSAPPTSWVGEPPPDTFRFPIAYFYIDSNETKAIWTSLVNYYDEVYFQFIFGEYGEPWGVGMWEHPYENNGWVPAITGLWPVR